MRQAEKQKKKILIPNSVHTRPEQENSQKNNKKSRKIIKHLPGNFFSQNGIRNDEKEGKNFSPEFRSYSTRARKFRKIYLKNSKNYKTFSRHYFQPKRDEIGRKREKNFSPEFRSYLTQARKFRKKIVKKFKKLKYLFLGLFLAKTG